MVADNTDSEWLKTFVARLNAGDMSEIDFDEAATRLTALSEPVAHATATGDGYAMLREDYQSRIAGMIKAMAAVERSTDALAEAAHQIDELAALSAEELVALYRRTTVRFRRHFPTSYGPRTNVMRTLPASAVKLFR